MVSDSNVIAHEFEPDFMKISVEPTFSLLQNEFEEHMVDSIKKLRASGLIVLENPWSTKVHGGYLEVMNLLQTEIRMAFKLMDISLLYMKIVKGDRSRYEPNF